MLRVVNCFERLTRRLLSASVKPFSLFQTVDIASSLVSIKAVGKFKMEG